MDTQEPLTVYVPADGSLPTILAGSGIVGSPLDGNGRIRLDYEGNKYRAANIVTFADRVYHAAGRHLVNYPTVARMVITPERVLPVATFDGDRVQIDGCGQISDGLALFRLAQWIDAGRNIGGKFRPNSEILTAELQRTGVIR